MAARFSGKGVVITGGASGIGLATARRFIADGAARVAIIDRAADLSRGLAASCAPRVSRWSRSGRTSARRTGHVTPWPVRPSGVVAPDVLLSNAAVPAFAMPFLETTMPVWDIELAVNLTASFVLGQEAARAMAAAGGGSSCTRHRCPRWAPAAGSSATT